MSSYMWYCQWQYSEDVLTLISIFQRLKRRYYNSFNISYRIFRSETDVEDYGEADHMRKYKLLEQSYVTLILTICESLMLWNKVKLNNKHSGNSTKYSDFASNSANVFLVIPWFCFFLKCTYGYGTVWLLQRRSDIESK